MSDGGLGGVLLAMAAGAIVAMPIAGVLVGLLGSRLVTVAAALALIGTLPLPILSANVPLLALALLVLGAANGTLDVAMNAQAVVVERRYARPIMSSLHALFSLGGLIGAGVAAVVMAAGVGTVAHLCVTSAVAGAAAAAAGRWLVTAPPADRTRAPTFAWPSAAVLALGGLTFLGLLAEGAMADWSAVYLHDALATSGSVAATGFAAFSLAMAAGRLVGDRLVARFGAARVLRTSGALATLGLPVALAVGDPGIAIAGFAAVGFGIANIVPTLFRAAANLPGTSAGVSLAAVATTGYFGLLAGPALIGMVAELTSLPVGLGLVSLACAIVTACSGVIAEAELPG